MHLTWSSLAFAALATAAVVDMSLMITPKDNLLRPNTNKCYKTYCGYPGCTNFNYPMTCGNPMCDTARQYSICCSESCIGAPSIADAHLPIGPPGVEVQGGCGQATSEGVVIAQIDL